MRRMREWIDERMDFGWVLVRVYVIDGGAPSSVCLSLPPSLCVCGPFGGRGE